MDRSIIHLNVADFAVAVERAIDRRLAGLPVVIAPPGAARAVVYDMSEEAYRAGVRKGMALARAARLCRDVRILPPRPERYGQAMRALLRHALPYSPRIEAGDIKNSPPSASPTSLEGSNKATSSLNTSLPKATTDFAPGKRASALFFSSIE